MQTLNYARKKKTSATKVKRTPTALYTYIYLATVVSCSINSLFVSRVISVSVISPSELLRARVCLLYTGELSAPHPLNWRQTAAQTVSLVIIVVVLMCFILSTALYYIVYVISCHPLIDFIIAF